MNRLFVFSIVILAVGFSSHTARSADTYSLIMQGKLDEAREALDQLEGDSAETGANLFFRALLEPDGGRSAKLLERALKRSPDEKYRDEIRLRLAQFYILTGDYRNATEVIDAGKPVSVGTPAASFDRLRILILEKTNSFDDARARLSQLQKTAVGDEWRRWALIDQARLSLALSKDKAANSALQSLARDKSGAVLPQALYLLCREAIDRGRVDDAARWYNMLKEAYPGAVGLDALTDKLGSMPTEPSKDTRAERATGTFYSVKVGVFASTENAAAQVDRFKRMKVKVESVQKTIGGKKYAIVYAGRYASFDDAEKAKQDFESQTGEQYQVVAR